MSRQVRKYISSRYSHNSPNLSPTQPREGLMRVTGVARFAGVTRVVGASLVACVSTPASTPADWRSAFSFISVLVIGYPYSPILTADHLGRHSCRPVCRPWIYALGRRGPMPVSPPRALKPVGCANAD